MQIKTGAEGKGGSEGTRRTRKTYVQLLLVRFLFCLLTGSHTSRLETSDAAAASPTTLHDQATRISSLISSVFTTELPAPRA